MRRRVLRFSGKRGVGKSKTRRRLGRIPQKNKMAFIVKKKIHNNEYYYLNENRRVEGKVKTKTLAYLGKTRKGAEKKMNEFFDNLKKKQAEQIVDKNVQKTAKGKAEISIEDLAAFCKRKGFVYQSGEIYGGLAGFWAGIPRNLVVVLEEVRKVKSS